MRAIVRGIHSARRANVVHIGMAALFLANPNLFEKVVKVDAVIHGDALIDG
jgi:hypothetical protein